MAHYLQERIYYPDGCSPDDDEAGTFAVTVVHRGRGKWSVHKGVFRHIQLSSTGTWLMAPARMNELTHCRHDFDTACALAEAAVEALQVHGMTWAQWAARGAARTGAAAEVEMLEAQAD